jgi:hypothetical protein
MFVAGDGSVGCYSSLVPGVAVIYINMQPPVAFAK